MTSAITNIPNVNKSIGLMYIKHHPPFREDAFKRNMYFPCREVTATVMAPSTGSTLVDPSQFYTILQHLSTPPSQLSHRLRFRDRRRTRFFNKLLQNTPVEYPVNHPPIHFRVVEENNRKQFCGLFSVSDKLGNLAL